ncbi:MAG: hypothetical protein ACK44B_11165, partial [Flavobacteriales bacterium]
NATFVRHTIVRCKKPDPNMYDYITLQSDSKFSKSINVDRLKIVLLDIDGVNIISSASGMIQLGDFKIVLQGIKCDSNGDYSFDDDSKFKEINMIEINIPQGAESEFENEIRQIVLDLSKRIGWQIDWRE